MEQLEKIAARHPQEELPPVHWVEHRPRCADCHENEVMNSGDACWRCISHAAQGWEPMEMLGRLANGAELDHGRRVHAVATGKRKAMCGAEPGRRSVGWSRSSGEEVTCPRCAKKAKPYDTVERNPLPHELWGDLTPEQVRVITAKE